MEVSASNTTLQQLKDCIHTSALQIQPQYQRLFYLGRELKNVQRTLSALSIGKYSTYVIQVLSSQPVVPGGERAGTSTRRRTRKADSKTANNVESIDLVSFSSPSTSGNGNRTRANDGSSAGCGVILLEERAVQGEPNSSSSSSSSSKRRAKKQRLLGRNSGTTTTASVTVDIDEKDPATNEILEIDDNGEEEDEVEIVNAPPPSMKAD